MAYEETFLNPHRRCCCPADKPAPFGLLPNGLHDALAITEEMLSCT